MIKAVAPAYDRTTFVAALGDIARLSKGPEAEVLHAGRNRVTALILPLEEDREAEVVVKEFGARGVPKLKTLVLPSKAARAWRGSTALVEAGFETPAPAAYLERRRRGVVVESIFVADRVRDGREVRSLFRELPEPEIRTLLAALVPVLVALHDAGFVHRDLSDGNILVLGDAASGYRFSFLDTNRVRRRRRVGSFGRARNLARLGVPTALQPDFAERYAAAAGGRAGAGFPLRYRAAKRTFARWLRLKKALRLRALARALRIQ